MLIAFVFCASFLFQTFTTGLQNSWLDDLDGPKFLRGAGQEIQDNEKLVDTSNDSPNDQKRGADVYVTKNTALNGKFILTVTANSKGITTTRWNKKKAQSPVPMYCGLHLTVFQLDRPSDPHTSLIPSDMVQLHRCVGGCANPHLQNCTVKSQEEVVIKVTEVYAKDHHVKVSTKNITVYNHTECECDCIKRKSDCDEKIHVYKKENCDCDCKYNQSLCNSATQRFSLTSCKCECRSAPSCKLNTHTWDSNKCKCKCNAVKVCNTTIQTWDEDKCECKCISTPKVCNITTGYTANHEWNPSICDCDCTQQVKNRCLRKGKVLNKPKCECECPPPSPPCTSGQKLQKSSCTCVDISVSTK